MVDHKDIMMASDLHLSRSLVSHESTSLSTRKRRKAKRRFGVRSHSEVFDLSDDSHRIEVQKDIIRKSHRRYAITSYSSGIPVEKIKLLQKFAIEDEEVQEEHRDYAPRPTIGTEKGDLMKKDKNLVVFKEDGSLDSKFEGSKTFSSLISIYHQMNSFDREFYRLQDIETHQSIMNNIIYDEIKQHGLQFMKKSLYHPDKFIVLDDMQALSKVKERLKSEGRNHTRQKRSSVAVL